MFIRALPPQETKDSAKLQEQSKQLETDKDQTEPADANCPIAALMGQGPAMNVSQQIFGMCRRRRTRPSCRSRASS